MTYPNLLDRFLTYVKVNTRSDEHSTTTPSTQSQVDFATNVLIPEMKRVGLQNVYYLPNGFAIGTLPANDPSLTRKIGFISHMDTADFNAEGVNPQVIENYDGGALDLRDSVFKLDPTDFKSLEKYSGQTLITTDGTTLLGADDKSGIAEIMTAIEYLTAHPEIKHCEIRVGFGPDEEIGVGANKFDAEDFDVDFAYTVDGGPLGELQYETFSAAAAELHFQGRNVHPGTAKGQMVNALQLAIDFHNQLPENDRMKEVIEKDMTPVTIAKDVMEDLGIKQIIEPIRGGTDGSKISFMGIPTPNIFAGGENMHGRFEYVSLQTMERAVDTIIGIVSYKD